MAAHAYFSHKQLQGLSGEEKKAKLLSEKGVDWNDYSSAEKQGVFVRKEKVRVQLEKERLEKIPVDERPEGGWVTRGKMVEIDMPDFLKVTNRNEVVFDGAEPL